MEAQRHTRSRLRPDAGWLAAAVLALLAPLVWARCLPPHTGEAWHVPLTALAREAAGRDGVWLPSRILRHDALGEDERLVVETTLPEAGRFSLYGLSSARGADPLLLEIDGRALSALAFWRDTGSRRNDFEEHRIAAGVGLGAGTHRITLRGDKIARRPLALVLRREAPLGPARAVLAFGGAFALLALRRRIARRAALAPRWRLVATAGGAAALLLGGTLFVAATAGHDLVLLGAGDVGRHIRLARFERELASPDLRALRAERFAVAVLGDSTHVFPHAPERQMIPTLERLLPEPLRSELVFYGIASGAFGPREFYLLANRLVREPPDLLVVPVNLRLFAPARLAAEGDRFHALERYLLLSELPAAWGPLELDPARLLLRRLDALVLDGRAALFLRGVKVAFERERDRIAARVSRSLGFHAPDEADPAPLPEWETHVTSEHPLIELLRLLDDLAEAHGIPVLYYSVQQNEAAWRARGVEPRLRESYGVVRDAVVERSGAYFLDLARESPPEIFADRYDHLTDAVLERPARRILEEVLEIRAERTGRASAERDDSG